MSSKAKFITVVVTDDFYRALINEASLKGMNVPDFASQVLKVGLETQTSDGFFDFEFSKEVELWKFAEQVTKKTEARRVLLSAATLYLRSPDEAALDKLEKLSAQYGLSYQEIMEEAHQLNPHPMAEVKNNTKVSAAYDWLISVMHPGQQYLLSEIKEKSENLDIKDWAIDEAKRALGIKSIKVSSVWYWVRPVFDARTGSEVYIREEGHNG